MGSFIKALKSAIFITTAILSGICLFILFTTFNINRTTLNPSYHKQLFEKHDIYVQTHTVISSSINQYIESLKKASPEDFEQHKQVFELLRKSITPEMVKYNLDSTREGLFQYFNGERKFLPDIYLNTGKSNPKAPEQKNIKTAVENEQNSPYQALSKIDKINLSAILLYINRSDISDSLFEIKFISYIINNIPGFFLPVLFFLALAGIYLSRRIIPATKWIAIFTLTCGVLCIISGTGMLYYTYSVLPGKIYPVVMSLPLKSDVLMPYLRDCISPVSVSILVFGIFLIILSAALFCFPKLIPVRSQANQNVIIDNSASTPSYGFMKNIIFIFFSLLLLSGLFYKTNTLRSDFEANGFNMAIIKMKNVNTVTQVISAKDEAVYTLNVKLVDSKDNTPIALTKVNVSGKSSVQEKYFYQTMETDETGIARFTLDKGAFRISFDSVSFPSKYRMPAPIFSELKSAGTTIITVNLEEPKVDEDAWGIAEIEVLDRGNKPIPNLELTVQGFVAAPGFPNDVFSVTNSDGIAVFRINPGNYKITFTREKFPKRYIMPIPIDTTVSAGSVTRYTIRVVDAAKDAG